MGRRENIDALTETLGRLGYHKETLEGMEIVRVGGSTKHSVPHEPSAFTVQEEDVNKEQEGAEKVILFKSQTVKVSLKNLPWVPEHLHDHSLWATGLWAEAIAHHEGRPSMPLSKFKDGVLFYLRWLDKKLDPSREGDEKNKGEVIPPKIKNRL